jgi:hypothetical protein
MADKKSVCMNKNNNIIKSNLIPVFSLMIGFLGENKTNHAI